MNVPSFVFRLLLCISLIANGVGNAQSSARMALAHAGHAVASRVDTAAAAAASEKDVPPCHRHRVARTPSDVDALAAQALPVAPSADPDGEPCCKGKACHCTCTPATFAATPALIAAPRAHAEPEVPRLAVDYPQPRLPHLIRPPIG